MSDGGRYNLERAACRLTLRRDLRDIALARRSWSVESLDVNRLHLTASTCPFVRPSV